MKIRKDWCIEGEIREQIQVKCQHVNDHRVVELVTTIWNEVFT